MLACTDNRDDREKQNGSVQRSETDQGVASLVLPADLEENVLVRDETFLPSHVASPPV